MHRISLVMFLVAAVGLFFWNESANCDEFDIMASVQVPVLVKKGQRLKISVAHNSRFEQSLSIYDMNTKRRIKIFNNTRSGGEPWVIENTNDSPILLGLTAHQKMRGHWSVSYFRYDASTAESTLVAFEDGDDTDFNDTTARVEISPIPE